MSASIVAELPAELRQDAAPARSDRLADLFAITLGTLITLAVQGYQFGQSNHGVYLLDAMRRADPALLRNDWFTSQTLQYHATFGWMSGWLFKLGILEPAFLIGYLLLAIAFHVAWLRLVKALGGDRITYLLSVVLFTILAGGFGLGMYHFLQDSAFLPSNVANVAMLWGITLWITRRPALAGWMLGISGLFHLNHAIVAVMLWGVMLVWDRDRTRLWRDRGVIIGHAGVGLCLISIAFALRATMGHTGAMPLDEFIDLYVRLRHPHHYDPSSWHWGLWATFLLPIPLAIVGGRLARNEANPDPAVPAARVEAARVFAFFLALIVFALVGAGLFYVSETLVQMSLYRFSIYLKLLSCIGAAYLLWNGTIVPRAWMRGSLMVLPVIIGGAALALARMDERMSDLLSGMWRPVVALCVLLVLVVVYAFINRRVSHKAHGGAVGALVVLAVVGWSHWLGFDLAPRDRESFIAFARRVRDVTDPDAIILVSPSEQLFRLHAQRAVVVNFKNVPQLSGEMIEWRRRMQRVLNVPDLRVLPRPYPRTLDAIRQRFESLPTDHLLDVARDFHARYLIVEHRLEPAHDHQLVIHDAAGPYFLYDLSR